MVLNASVIVLVGLLAFIGLTTTDVDEGDAEAGYDTQYRPPPPAPAQEDGSAAERPPGTTAPRAVVALADHPLHTDPDTGLALRDCPLPTWRPDPAAAKRFYERALACLDAVWEPAMAAAGLPFVSPSIAVPASGGAVQSPCSQGNAGSDVAFYCPGNFTIYLPMDRWRMRQHGETWPVILADLAHEYAHHVQGLSGILEASWHAQYEAGHETDSGLELSRRQELQAQCFGGMFFGSGVAGGWLSENAWNQAHAVEFQTGDSHGPRTHGSPQNYGGWWQRGSEHNRTQQCNTWAASASDVS